MSTKGGRSHDPHKPRYIGNGKRLDVYLGNEAYTRLAALAESEYRSLRAEASLLLETAIAERDAKARAAQPPEGGR